MLGLRSPKRPVVWIIAREKELRRWPEPRRKAMPPDMPSPELNDEVVEGEESEQGTTAKEDHSKPYPSWPRLLPFCTQACLLGLTRQHLLDDACPNVHLHRAARERLQEEEKNEEKNEETEQEKKLRKKKPNVKKTVRDSHPLTAEQLRARLQKQAETDNAVHIRSLEKSRLYGRYGVLVRVTLAGFGYTMVAKGIEDMFYGVLDHELAIYEKLAAVQGRLVPVCLGLIDLPDTFNPGPRCTPLIQLLLLSFAGLDLAHLSALPYHVDLQEELDRTARDLARLGLRDEDIRVNNGAWNAEVQRVMHFDFDKATFVRVEPTEDEVPPEVEPAAEAAAFSSPRSPLQAKRHWNDTLSSSGSANSLQTKRRAVD